MSYGVASAPLRFRRDLVSGYVDELRLLVDEPFDEPRTRDAIHARVFAGDPLHRSPPCARCLLYHARNSRNGGSHGQSQPDGRRRDDDQLRWPEAPEHAECDDPTVAVARSTIARCPRRTTAPAIAPVAAASDSSYSSCVIQPLRSTSSRYMAPASATGPSKPSVPSRRK